VEHHIGENENYSFFDQQVFGNILRTNFPFNFNPIKTIYYFYVGEDYFFSDFIWALSEF
jgi:hypothetical protein